MGHAGARVSLALLLAAAAATLAPPAGADVQPGDVITKANVDKVKDLIWCYLGYAALGSRDCKDRRKRERK